MGNLTEPPDSRRNGPRCRVLDQLAEEVIQECYQQGVIKQVDRPRVRKVIRKLYRRMMDNTPTIIRREAF